MVSRTSLTLLLWASCIEQIILVKTQGIDGCLTVLGTRLGVRSWVDREVFLGTCETALTPNQPE